jgi:hypothetical protein
VFCRFSSGEKNPLTKHLRVANIEEIDVNTICEECKRCKALMLGDLGNV